MSAELRLAITNNADPAVARALVLRFALAHGFDRRRAAELALVASEMVSNVLKYAGEGELIVTESSGESTGDGSGPPGIVVSTHDNGPGPPSAAALFGDGFSRGAPRLPGQSISTGRGTGGGAMQRLCDSVEILARPGGGSIIRCHKLRTP